MHIDEQKKFDIRNVEQNMKDGTITHKDYEIYLSKLPDMQNKIFNLEELAGDFKDKDIDSKSHAEGKSKKKTAKKKAKGKGK